MYLLGRRFEEIDWATLEEARAESTEESRTLDFKRDLPDLNSRDSKREFLEDVCAFANTSGGLLLYGVDEARDENTKLGHIDSLPGIPTSAIPADFKPKVQELIRSSFDPRFAGVAIDWIESADGKRVLKVGVERSLVAPHRVKSNGSREFMLRAMTSSEKMDAEQIREAVRRSLDASQGARERVRALAKIASEAQIPVSLTPRTGYVRLWGCAVPAFKTSLPQSIGSPIVANTLRKFRDYSGFTEVVVHYDHLGAFLATKDPPSFPLTRLHRDGTVERFRLIETRVLAELAKGETWIVTNVLADEIAALGDAIPKIRGGVGVAGPMIVVFGLFGTAGLLLDQVYVKGHLLLRPPRAIEPSSILLEPTETTDEFLGRILKSAADLFWNAGGHPFCGGFDGEGNRTAGLA